MSGLKKIHKKAMAWEKKVFKKTKQAVKKVMKNKIFRAIIIAAAIYFTAGAAAGVLGGAGGAGAGFFANAAAGIQGAWGAVASGFSAGGIGGALSGAGAQFSANLSTIFTGAAYTNTAAAATNTAAAAAPTLTSGAPATAATGGDAVIGASAEAGAGIGGSAGTGSGIGATAGTGSTVGTTSTLAPVQVGSTNVIAGAGTQGVSQGVLADMAIAGGKSVASTQALGAAMKTAAEMRMQKMQIDDEERARKEAEERRRKAFDFSNITPSVYNPSMPTFSQPQTRPVSLADVVDMQRSGYVTYQPAYVGG